MKVLTNAPRNKIVKTASLVSRKKRIKVGTNQEMSQSERNPVSKKLGEKNLNCQSGTYSKRTYRKPGDQLFFNRRPLSYPNSIKYSNFHSSGSLLFRSGFPIITQSKSGFDLTTTKHNHSSK